MSADLYAGSYRARAWAACRFCGAAWGKGFWMLKHINGKMPDVCQCAYYQQPAQPPAMPEIFISARSYSSTYTPSCLS